MTHEDNFKMSDELRNITSARSDSLIIARDYVISRMPEMRMAAARGANRIECNVYIYEGDDTRLGELSASGLKRAFNILGFFVENYTDSVASIHFELLWI